MAVDACLAGSSLQSSFSLARFLFFSLHRPRTLFLSFLSTFVLHTPPSSTLQTGVRCLSLPDLTSVHFFVAVLPWDTSVFDLVGCPRQQQVWQSHLRCARSAVLEIWMAYAGGHAKRGKRGDTNNNNNRQWHPIPVLTHRHMRQRPQRSRWSVPFHSTGEGAALTLVASTWQRQAPPPFSPTTIRPLP